ncbi:MAG: hypothetical protein QW303_01665 [Nitrososphaerota archaeon]
MTKYEYILRGENGEPLSSNTIYNEHGIVPEAVVAFREASGIEAFVYADTATIDNSVPGKIIFTVPKEVRETPGIYDVEAAYVQPNSSTLFAINKLYFYNEPSHWGTKHYTLPSLSEIRLSLRDSSPIENELLGNYDFDTSEICFALTRVIQLWNETPPPVTLYTTRNFPFKHLWLLGAQLFLFQIAEEHYRRNQFAYNAGGMSVDDRNKLMVYRAAVEDRMQMFMTSIYKQKYRINASSSATLGGNYSIHIV